MTLAVALSVSSVRVFYTHFLESVVTPGWSLFCHYLLACCYNFLCIFSEAACFPFVELTLLNKVALLPLIFVFVFVFVSVVKAFFRKAYGKKLGLSRTYSLLAPGFRRQFCQRGLLRRLARMTERSEDGRNSH